MAHFISREKSCEFSLGDLRSEEGRQGLLCISQSTWMLAYSLVSFYGYWRSRYYKVNDLGGYLETLTDSEWEEVTNYVDLAIEELSMSNCDDLTLALEGLNATLQAFQACCASMVAAGAQLNQDGPNNGVVTVGGPYDTFETQQDYLDAKCTVANAIYDTVYAFADKMDFADITSLAAGDFGGVTAVLSYWLQATPLGWAIAKVESFMTGLAILVIGATEPDYADIKTAMASVKTALVTGLYNAGDTVNARANFLAALGGSTPSISGIELDFVTGLLTYDALNQLFDPRGDLIFYSPPSPVNCAASVLQTWDFETTDDGFTFEDRSDGTLTTSGSWVSGSGFWRMVLDMTSGSGAYAAAYIKKTGLSIAVGPGNSVQMDFSAPSDGIASNQRIHVICSDATEYLKTGNYTTAGTIVLNIPASKTISSVEIGFAREYNPSYNYTIDCLEVRVQ